MRRAAVAPVVVVFVVLAGACTSISSDAKKSTPSKAGFIAQADEICTTYQDRTAKASRTLKHPNVDRQIAIVQGRVLPILQRRDAQLAQLKPPASDRAAVTQFIADLKATTDAIALDPGAYVAQHGTSALAQKAAAEGAALGFEVCGRT